MICGKKLNMVALFLLLALLPVLSQSLPSWAESMTETESKILLVESIARLETTTNELEKSNKTANDWKNFATELQTKRKADLELFKIIGTSFSEYKTEQRKAKIKIGGISFGVGIGIGAVVFALLK